MGSQIYFTGSIEFCESNSRFYATRGEQIYSFKFDGTDLRLEYSFGENGKNFNSDYNTLLIRLMHVYNDSLYFLRPSNTSGSIHLFKYDTKTKEICDLSIEKGYGEESYIYNYFIVDNAIYIEISDSNGPKIIKTDMDMQDEIQLEYDTSIMVPHMTTAANTPSAV